MTKQELLLVKKSQVESVLGETIGRAERTQQKLEGHGNAKKADVFDDFFAGFEALTAMTIVGETAVIPLRGVVTPDDPFAILYGETSLAMFNKNVDKALADPKVKSIVLNIFSPGGYVYGVEAAANKVYEARQQKQIYAYTDSLAASAAYWLASAAHKVILGSETAEVGSIGVYLVHFDYSEMLKESGIKVTEVTSGEFKGLGSPYSPLTTEEKAKLQEDSDYVYTRFVETVARNRGMEAADVLKSANGLTFYGSAAIKAGLADSINTLQEVIAMTTAANTPTPAPTPEAQAAAAAQAQATTQAHNDALAAANAKAQTAEAELKAFKEQAAKEAKDRAAVECQNAVKGAFGREATAEEVSAYQEMSEAGRKFYKDTLAESRANHDRLVQVAGLTQEQALGGQGEEQSLENNLVYQAAKSLGYIQGQ